MDGPPDCPRCSAIDSSRSQLLYLAARYLHISAPAWDALHSDDRRAYVDGFVAQRLLALPSPPPALAHRTIDTGGGVIDLQEMIRTSQAS